MAKKDDVTSSKNATLASKVLSGAIKPTSAQVKTLAAVALDNAANKPRGKK
ncbi:MAG: hypothetical protein QOE22_695 [Candidatus Parcubacteria bacterium]|jgi:hypothetical protein|nr:hypothetical protein [Candidatus Parcubacteria bacterium]